MVSLFHKSKQYLWALLKVVILAFVFLFIYKRLSQADFLTWKHFKDSTLFNLNESKWILVTCLILTLINWVFEIIKWQQLVHSVSSISFNQAARETLAGSTLTFITPAKIGDYGIKAAYYAKEQRNNILAANLIGNGVQLLVTLFFGAIACCYFLFSRDNQELKNIIFITIALGICAAILLYLFRNKKMVRTEISVVSVIKFAKSFKTSIQQNVILLSVLRYSCFSVSFYLLLCLFGGNISFIEAIAPIFAMYFFSSLLPSFFIIDPALKGGIAAYLLSFYAVSLISVLCAALAMWLLNFALPAIIGSYFVMTFKPQKAV